MLIRVYLEQSAEIPDIIWLKTFNVIFITPTVVQIPLDQEIFNLIKILYGVKAIKKVKKED